MPVVSVAAERSVEAPAEEVYRRIADFRARRGRYRAQLPHDRRRQDPPRVMCRIYADELERLDRCAIAGSG